MTNYRISEKPSENLDFLPIQNIRQYHFHDVAKYENISPKESVDQNEEYVCLSLDERLPWYRP